MIRDRSEVIRARSEVIRARSEVIRGDPRPIRGDPNSFRARSAASIKIPDLDGSEPTCVRERRGRPATPSLIERPARARRGDASRLPGGGTNTGRVLLGSCGSARGAGAAPVTGCGCAQGWWCVTGEGPCRGRAGVRVSRGMSGEGWSFGHKVWRTPGGPQGGPCSAYSAAVPWPPCNPAPLLRKAMSSWGLLSAAEECVRERRGL